MFNGLRSNWMTLSHVWLDLPGGRFQSDGGLRIVAATAGDIYKLLAYTVSKAIIASAFFFNTFTVFNTHRHYVNNGGTKMRHWKMWDGQKCLFPRLPVLQFGATFSSIAFSALSFLTCKTTKATIWCCYCHELSCSASCFSVNAA